MNLLQLDNQICFKLYSASRLLTQAYAPILEPLDLTYPQYLAMLVLWETEHLSVKELGEKLKLDSGTLSPLIKKLELKGFLIRMRLPDDERVVTLALTPAGKELKRKAQNVPEKIFCQIQLQIKEARDLKKRLDQLVVNLEESLESI